MLLPYLLAGLSASVVADYRAASYMIIGQLAARATFTADLASGACLGFGAVVMMACTVAKPFACMHGIPAPPV